MVRAVAPRSGGVGLQSTTRANLSQTQKSTVSCEITKVSVNPLDRVDECGEHRDSLQNFSVTLPPKRIAQEVTSGEREVRTQQPPEPSVLSADLEKTPEQIFQVDTARNQDLSRGPEEELRKAEGIVVRATRNKKIETHNGEFFPVRVLTEKGCDADVLLVTDKDGREFVAKIAKPGRKKNVSAELKNLILIKEKVNQGSGAESSILHLEDFALGKRTDPVLILEKGICDLESWAYSRKFESESQLKKMLREILAGIRELHSLGMVHADIKLDNFIVVPTSSEKNLIKLADFARSFLYVSTPGRESRVQQMTCSKRSSSAYLRRWGSGDGEPRDLTLTESQHKMDLLQYATEMKRFYKMIIKSNEYFATDEIRKNVASKRAEWMAFFGDIESTIVSANDVYAHSFFNEQKQS